MELIPQWLPKVAPLLTHVGIVKGAAFSAQVSCRKMVTRRSRTLSNKRHMLYSLQIPSNLSPRRDDSFERTRSSLQSSCKRSQKYLCIKEGVVFLIN